MSGSVLRPRILLIRPDHLGDVLLTRPAIEALARAVPEATLTVAVGPWGRPALGPRPTHDILICPFPGFSRASLHPILRYWLLLHYARLLRRERYTMAIIARSDHWWGALLVALAGIPVRIGYDVPETKPFLTLSIPWAPAMHSPAIVPAGHNPYADPSFGGRRAPGRGWSRSFHPRPTGVGTPAGGPIETRPHPAAAGFVSAGRPQATGVGRLRWGHRGPRPPGRNGATAVAGRLSAGSTRFLFSLIRRRRRHPRISPRPRSPSSLPRDRGRGSRKRTEAPLPCHAALDALLLAEVAARSLGRDLDETAPYPLPTDAGPAECAVVDRLLAESGIGNAPFVVLQPGAGSPLKAWPAERLAAVGAALAQEFGARVVVSGSAAERVLAQQVCDALPGGAINLAGVLQWTELEALLARATLVVGVDSGPLHLAAAASTPSVALFGPADPAQFGPWGDAAGHHVVTADLPCRPCRRLDWCALEPEGIGPPPCMRAIAIETVVNAALAALAEGNHGPKTTD